ncbi:MAG TPA: hypothetical protein VMT86_13375 [Bryobacteraceae bacterium]|nr:hypothetical protein [Bryobacteraceae bacterium]
MSRTARGYQAEASWVLTSVFELNTASLITAIAMLLNHGDLTLQDPEAIKAALDLLRKHPSLGFSDCLMLELARKAGHIPLGTFDRALGRMPGPRSCNPQ